MAAKKLLTVLLPCIGLSLCAPLSAHTIQEAVSLAIETGPDMARQSNRAMRVRQELRESYGGYLPSVDLSGGYGRERSNNATTRGITIIGANNTGSRTLDRTELSVSARQMLFDGFAVKNDVEGNMARVRAEAWRTAGTAEDVAIDTISAFLDTNRNKEIMKIAKDNLDAHLRISGQITKRSESGIGRRADLDQSTARVSFARSQLVASQVNYKDAQSNFQRIAGIPAIGLVNPALPTAGFPKTLRSAIAEGINNNQVLRAAVSDVSVARHNKATREAAFYPRLDLELSASRNYNLDGVRGSNDDSLAMLRTRWNLFNGGSDVARVKNAAWEIQEAQEVRNRAHRQVEESVRLAWSLYTGAKLNKQNNLQHSLAAERTRDAYTKQFDIGQRTLLDLLDSENEVFSARTNYINAKYDELLGAFRVLHDTGALVKYLGVAMPSSTQIEGKNLLKG